MKIIELFAGYGSQALALKNLGFEVESKISEIDKYAIQAYEQLHGKTFNYGDISKIKSLGDADLWTYSFPCQDLSVAGKQAGISEGTRSGLLYEVERLLEIAAKNKNKPKYLLLENVKALVSKKFKPDFDRWLEKLDSLGYNNYWQVLNAKDYGIPQNRERVFVVSIRKDVDTKGYKFPSPVPLQKRLKDMLEPQVDEKYYLSADKVEKLLSKSKTNLNEQTTAIISKQGTCLDKITDIACTLMARDYKGFGNQGTNGVVEPLCAASRGRNPENPSDRTVGAPTEQRLEINETGCSNTLTSVQKDNYVVEPFIADNTQGFDGVRYYNNYSPTLRSKCSGLKVVEPLHIREATKKGYVEAYLYDSVNLEQPNSKTRRGRVGNQVSNTLLCSCNVGVVASDYRIRKLTPRECWRLMGVKDEQYDKLYDISNTQLYKMAGNSIVVDVLMGIFKNLFLSDEGTSGQLTLF